MAVNIGPRIGIEGESEYRKQLNGIIQQSKLLASEMKALTTSFDKNGKSLEQNAKQHKLLQEQIKNQESRITAIKGMVEKATQAYEESKKQLELHKDALIEDTEAVKLLEKSVDANAQKINQYQTALNNATADLNKMKGELDAMPSSLDLVAAKMANMGQKLETIGTKMTSIGRKLTSTVTTGIVSAFGASVKSAVDWESAFTGVMKTVDETATTTYADLEKAIMNMATETASSKEEIAGVAEVAGQLGVSADDIAAFTKTMVMLGDTTNLSAEEAATALARFMNITGESQDNVERIGSAIVDLGNNFATTESEIVNMATKLASAGTIAGLSSTDILALSTAMSSVGIEAEAGGTAMSQTLKTMSKAVSDFKSGEAEDLEVIAKVAKMSAGDFAEAWEGDPVRAIQSFVKGLSQVKDEGENVFEVLGEMGMTGIRQTNMIQSLALASDMLAGAINTAGQAYKDNTALSEEAAKRYGTFAAQLSQLKQSISNLAIVFGNDLLPYVQKAIDYIGGLVKKFSQLDESQRAQIIKMAAIAAALGPLLMGGGKLVNGISKLLQSAPAILSSCKAIGAVLGGISAPVLAVVAAVGVLVAAFKNLWDNNEQFRSGMTETWNGIKESFSGFVAQIQERLPQIQEAFSNFIAIVKPIWDGFCQLLGPAFQAAFDAVKIILDALFNAIINVIDMITGILTADKELFMQGLMGFLNTIWTYLLNWWTILWTWLTETINVVLSFFGTSIDELWDKLVSFLSDLLDAIIEKVTEMVEWTINKVTEMVDYIASLPDRFYQWGVDMMQSLIDGIRSMISAVGEIIEEVAGTIAEFLHFSEPDKGPLSNFNSWMPDMMKQMAEQIEAGRYQVKVAAANVAADIAAPMAGARNVTLNNNFTFGGEYTEADGRSIVRQINRQLGALYI